MSELERWKAFAKILQEERDRLRERVEELEGALQKVIAHTGYLPSADRELLEGLLASCERIARQALQEDDDVDAR